MEALKTAIFSYGVTRAFRDGSTRSERLPLELIDVDPITAAMRRMVRTLEFDICEMAFTTYLCARAAGIPITAIPIFLTRGFWQRAVVYNTSSGIKAPKDLEGRIIGVNRGYTVTTGLWARGILQDEYGVDLNKVTWAPTDDEHVTQYKAPANVDYANMGKTTTDLLLSGEFPAAVGDMPPSPPETQPLIPDAFEAGAGYYRRTGVFPLNHTVVIQDSLLESDPWVAEELFAGIMASRDAYVASLKAKSDPTPADQMAMRIGEVTGDPFPMGVEANRKTLETIVRFAAEQNIISKPFAIEDLFAKNTQALS